MALVQENKVIKLDRPMNIYQKINAVMEEVEAIQKEDKKVNNQYRFVSHDAVAKALHRPLTKHGIVTIPTVADIKQEGNRTEIKLDVTFINCENPEDKFTVSFPGYGIDPSDKGIGKAISYAFKYCLLKTFCLETGDDVEKDDIKYQPSPKLDPNITPEQIEEINVILETLDDTFYNKMLAFCKVDHIGQIKQSQFDVCKKALQHYKEQR